MAQQFCAIESAGHAYGVEKGVFLHQLTMVMLSESLVLIPFHRGVEYNSCSLHHSEKLGRVICCS